MTSEVAVLNPGVLYEYILKENKLRIFDSCYLIKSNQIQELQNIANRNIRKIYIDDFEIPFRTQVSYVGNIDGVCFLSLTDFYEKFTEKAAFIEVNNIIRYPNYIFELEEKKIYSLILRFFDILFSIILLTIAAILIFLACLLLLIFSGWPLIFTQYRVGKNGHNFTIFKLRTMVVSDSLAHTTVNDNRVFPLGMFFRKFKIDELPQLFNILMGQMSFFGPRPERSDLHDKICNSIPFFPKRLLVRPGLSGWAQIKNPKATPEQSFEKLQYDIYFIRHISILMILKIVFRTIEVLIKKNSL